MSHAYSYINEFGVIDPHYFQEEMWPHYNIYDKQREIVDSFEYNNITIVPSANKTGKDFIAGLCAVSMYIRHPICRILTTSVRGDNIDILWAEMNRHINECKFPLKAPKGCLRVKHMDIRKIRQGKECPISYMKGLVSERPEGFAGHHAPWTAALIDEASGVDDQVLEHMLTWAKRVLIIGNCNPCTNFFQRFVKEGDMLAPSFN